MQTAAISYRVADFLKQYPPFDSMGEEDLLALAGRGRVKFHETDECFLWQGEKPGPHVFVIQQGSVSLWEKGDDGERLRDLLGPGEVVGVERYRGHEVNPWSARTNGDVVVYALDALEFGRLMEKYPAVANHLAWEDGGQEVHTGEAAPAREIAHEDCAGPLKDGATIAEAARAMARRGVTAVAIGDGGRVVRAECVLRWIADGGGDASLEAAVLSEEVPVVREDATAAACALRMAEGAQALLVKREGRPAAVLTPADLARVLGEDLGGIVRLIRGAADTAELRRLNVRVRGFLKEQLRSAAQVEWMSRYAQVVDGAIVRRVMELCDADMERTCWCFHGAAGRGESLTAVAPAIAMIGADGAMCDGVVEQLERCGYLARDGNACVGTLEEWSGKFSGWIASPVLSGAASALSYFDLFPVCGSGELWNRLKESVEADVRAAEHFTTVMAHDCLANLPPLTFYQELVVEETGEQTGLFRLEKSALRPLVNVARVFGMEAGMVLGASSLDRLRAARLVALGGEAILREAGEALRVVLSLQARAGLRQRDEGFEMPAARIDARERHALKRGFRSILGLLEFTEEFKWKGR